MTSVTGRPDFTNVTEVTGEAVRPDAVAKMHARYAFAASRARDKDVLEVACGSGQGLGMLAGVARSIVAGDLTFDLLRGALAHYQGRIALVCFDGHALPFVDESFDLVLCYEALYYMAQPDRFLRETRRVLRPGGELLLVSVNPTWPGFNPSPMSTRYHSATALRQLLRDSGFEPLVYGAFPEADDSPRARAVATVRRVAVALHLVPQTMRGKRLLKRVFYGRLERLPAELPPLGGPSPHLDPLTGDSRSHTVLYAIGKR